MIEILRNGINSSTMIYLVAFLFAVVISITCHEFSHGYVALKQGDDTAKLAGRLTLNPLAHFDLFGFLSFLLFGFGWAKPVPINPLRFKEYRKGIFLTSIAGIVCNIFLAFFSAGGYVLFCNIAVAESSTFVKFVVLFFQYFFYLMCTINISLFVFNLLPIAPLDGYNLVASLSPANSKFVRFMRKYGVIILIVLVISTLLNFVLSYVVDFLRKPFIDFWEWVL
jgi:Zn-dependent protease